MSTMKGIAKFLYILGGMFLGVGFDHMGVDMPLGYIMTFVAALGLIVFGALTDTTADAP